MKGADITDVAARELYGIVRDVYQPEEGVMRTMARATDGVSSWFTWGPPGELLTGEERARLRQVIEDNLARTVQWEEDNEQS